MTDTRYVILNSYIVQYIACACMQGLNQWEPKSEERKGGECITNGWVPIQLLNPLERAYMHLKRQIILVKLSIESMAHG